LTPASARGAPKHRTRTSARRRSSRARYSTCTPAPPYTSGGYSRLNRSTRITRTLAADTTKTDIWGFAGLCGGYRLLMTPRVLAIVLAGGEGKRLMPLTADRAKPAVPFGGIYRLIDFVLSNLTNGNYLRIVVLTQYKSHSLDRHISRTWRLSAMLGNYVAPVPAQQRLGPRWFAGSADALFQNLNLIYDEMPEHVLVFGADHIYRMDPRQMVQQHAESGADVTVAAI